MKCELRTEGEFMQNNFVKKGSSLLFPTAGEDRLLISVFKQVHGHHWDAIFGTLFASVVETGTYGGMIVSRVGPLFASDLRCGESHGSF